MKTESYVRNPLVVDALRVTDENFNDVAEWCKGEIRQDNDEKFFIFLQVRHPLHSRQKKAYVGDWILKTKSGYKIYPDDAFKANFNPGTGHSVSVANVFGSGPGTDPVPTPVDVKEMVHSSNSENSNTSGYYGSNPSAAL